MGHPIDSPFGIAPVAMLKLVFTIYVILKAHPLGEEVTASVAH